MASNDVEFTGPARQRNRDFARGWSPRDGKFIGGITYPEEGKIPQRKLMVRIGHSHDATGAPIPDWFNLTSPWWMHDATFLDMAGRSEEAGTPIQQMARMKLALTPEFGVSDTLFLMVTKDSLRTWSGRARPVMEDPDPAVRAALDRPMAWLGGYEVVQHFIPGLRDFARGAPTAIALSSLAVLPKVALSAYASLRAGGFGFIKFPWPV